MFARPIPRLLGRSWAKSSFHSTATFWASKRVVHKFKLADIGEGITECEVIKWSVKPLQVIQAFDPLCEVQSDKASVEITSPFEGVVKELLVQEGEVAKVGAGLCLIEVDEETKEGEEVEKEALTPAVEIAPPSVEEPSLKKRGVHPLDPKYVPEPGKARKEDVFAAPSVRHLARQNGVDLGLLVPGSGKAGRIEKRDVEAYLARSTTTEQTSPLAVADQQEDVVVELGRTRYGMWKAMVKSLEIPHFGYSTTLDVTELHNLLPIFNNHIPPHFLPSTSEAQPPPPVNPSALYPAPSPPRVTESQQFTRLTYLPILLKTLSKAMIEWPLLRSSITLGNNDPTAKPSLTIRPSADISIALSTPSGLYTPTLQSVNTHSFYSLTSQLKHLSYLGRQTPCGLTPKEMPKRGGTVTVSNVGAIGAGEFASPVLVPGGGVAIVAIGRAKWVWDVDRGDGKGERRLKVGISWSADHRVVEGAELAAFVECWRGYVEVPQRLIAEGV